jgi:hypothetical protein
MPLIFFNPVIIGVIMPQMGDNPAHSWARLALFAGVQVIAFSAFIPSHGSLFMVHS